MNREELILRELHLYPLWKRREQAVPEVAFVTVASEIAAKIAMPQNENPENIILKNEISANEILANKISENKNSIDISSFDWPQLKSAVKHCTACALRAGCTQTVLGVGPEQADWLFVGEASGAEEDAQGEPFVGQAGVLLNNMLAAIKLKRGTNVYLTNVVKCRPLENRTPGADEISQCLPYLERQIALIRPKLIVALGKVASTVLLGRDSKSFRHISESLKVASTVLLGRDSPLASLRGEVHDYHGIPLIATYHPAYLLRAPQEKAKAWQDLRLAVATMQSQTVS